MNKLLAVALCAVLISANTRCVFGDNILKEKVATSVGDSSKESLSKDVTRPHFGDVSASSSEVFSSLAPTDAPSTVEPTNVPTTEEPTSAPSSETPTKTPPDATTVSLKPTDAPTTETHSSLAPTDVPTTKTPTDLPTTEEPTSAPSSEKPTVRPTDATTVSPTPPHCQPGERKGIEHSCRDFYECDKTFAWVHKTCNAFCQVYDSESLKCVWNWQKPCLKPPTAPPPPPTTGAPSTVPPTGTASSGTVTSPDITTTVPKCSPEGSQKQLKKGDCKNYLKCTSGKWVQQTCSFGYDFDINKLTCVFSWFASKCN